MCRLLIIKLTGNMEESSEKQPNAIHINIISRECQAHSLRYSLKFNAAVTKLRIKKKKERRR